MRLYYSPVCDYTNQHESSSRFPHSYIDHELSRIEKYVTRAITRVSRSSDTLGSRRILDTRRGLIAIRQNIYDNREMAMQSVCNLSPTYQYVRMYISMVSQHFRQWINKSLYHLTNIAPISLLRALNKTITSPRKCRSRGT